MTSCDLVYPLPWNGQGTEASVCEDFLQIDYEVESTGWEI